MNDRVLLLGLKLEPSKARRLVEVLNVFVGEAGRVQGLEGVGWLQDNGRGSRLVVHTK